MTESKEETLCENLGMIWSDESEAWVHSRYGTGLTSQIDVELAAAILAEVAKAEKRGELLALESLPVCTEAIAYEVAIEKRIVELKATEHPTKERP